MPLIQPLMPCTRPNFDGRALFNFRIFLKVGASILVWGRGQVAPTPTPLAPTSPGGPGYRLFSLFLLLSTFVKI